LRGRLSAIQRRGRKRPRLTRMRIGEMEIDPLGRGVWVGTERVALAKKVVRAPACAGQRPHTCVHARGTTFAALGLPVDGRQPTFRPHTGRIPPASLRSRSLDRRARGRPQPWEPSAGRSPGPPSPPGPCAGSWRALPAEPGPPGRPFGATAGGPDRPNCDGPDGAGHVPTSDRGR
jgi:hypothetical protein